METTSRSRRRSRRYALSEGLEGTVEFAYPQPGEPRCAMPLRDLSPSGLSFTLAHELPGLEVGTSIKRATLRVGSHSAHGDLVVIHLTPDDSRGSVCGTIFYPRTDADVVKLNALIAELEDESA